MSNLGGITMGYGGGSAHPDNSIVGTLQATELLDSGKPVLPAEILAMILDYLPIPALMRCARASRRLCEMVYDDTRWVARLKSMGVWDEVEARRRFEEALRRRRREQAEQNSLAAANGGDGRGSRGAEQGTARQRHDWKTSTMLFDASAEEEGPSKLDLRDGFETLKVTGAGLEATKQDPESLLQVMQKASSVRGRAREEYGKIYGALAPFYLDMARAKNHTEPVVFRVFKDPERQAQMLANLQAFARSDWAGGWHLREERLAQMAAVFKSAVLREFEQAYNIWDMDGRMRRFARVLDTLDGGAAAVELFVHKHPVFSDKELRLDSTECIRQAPVDGLELAPSRRFFELLAVKVNEQAGIIERIFPKPGPVYWLLLDKVRENVVMDYATPLFDVAHARNKSSYLMAVSGLFEQTLQFFRTLRPPQGAVGQQEAKAKELALKTFEPHLDLYLQEELDHFTKQAEDQVRRWDQQLSEQDATNESLYLGNCNRQADKKDFLTSFKKVVMMPVSVLPTTLGGPFGGTTKGSAGRTGTARPGKAAPTDELAAKAALMSSRLEGIKSLFSIEVALNLVHAAKASLGRASAFMQLGGQAGGEAREQCATMFVVLLRILGNRHFKPGFVKAVGHLSQYKPRSIHRHDGKGGVAPLVTFIELVNVGDLIAQMVDVFYEQQLAGPGIADRNNFLDPAGLAKKRFEQMLDESVAAGLNKGIDVLMDEVEWVCATTQLPAHYNPEGDQATGAGDPGNSMQVAPWRAGSVMGSTSGGDDIGPTLTATRVRDLVASHTRMLVGSTEKSMLDVFNGEVGLRLFTALCKHLKRQRISQTGAVKLIADVNLYFDWARSIGNPDLLAYFGALRELAQIYLIDARSHAKEMATIIADSDRFGGVFRAEEVYEYAERRADWYSVRREVERAMYGFECVLI